METMTKLKPVLTTAWWTEDKDKSWRDEKYPVIVLQDGHDGELLMYMECSNCRERDRVMAKLSEVFGDSVEVVRR